MTQPAGRPEHRDTGDPAPNQREVPRDSPTGVDLKRVIGRQVRNLRTASGLSVGDMAAKIGILKAMLSKIENAQTSCSPSTVARLAAGLDVPVTSLFRGVDSAWEAVFPPVGHGAVIVRRGTHVGRHYELLVRCVVSTSDWSRYWSP